MCPTGSQTLEDIGISRLGYHESKLFNVLTIPFEATNYRFHTRPLCLDPKEGYAANRRHEKSQGTEINTIQTNPTKQQS